MRWASRCSAVQPLPCGQAGISGYHFYNQFYPNNAIHLGLTLSAPYWEFASQESWRIPWSMLAWRSLISGSTSPTISATPLIIPQGLIALGAGLLALQMLARLIRLIIKESPEDESTSFQVE